MKENGKYWCQLKLYLISSREMPVFQPYHAFDSTNSMLDFLNQAVARQEPKLKLSVYNESARPDKERFDFLVFLFYNGLQSTKSTVCFPVVFLPPWQPEDTPSREP